MRGPPRSRQTVGRPAAETTVRHGIARAISRAGICSRTEAAARVRAGRVQVDGRLVFDPEHPTTAASRIEIDGHPIGAAERIHLMLNKPRGLVTSTADERGRSTVYQCLEGAGLPWLAPVGRLDKASEGLLLFSNDPQWAAGITEPTGALLKVYHVQIDGAAPPELLAAMVDGVDLEGERLRAHSATVVRSGERNTWLQVTLDEGRNRHIRRLLEAFGVGVLRLLRISIGALELGDLAKGSWRYLTAEEVALLAPVARD